MTTVDKASRINAFVQTAFRNGMDTVENVHQKMFEIPVDVARELGLPKDKAELVKTKHRRILDNVYGAVLSAHKDIGTLAVGQIGEFVTLANDLGSGGRRKPVPAGNTVAKKPSRSKKTAPERSSGATG